MVKIALLIVLMSSISYMLFAQTDIISSDVGRLPSLVIDAKGTNVNNFELVNIEDNKLIPISDLSRQFVEPGTYSITHELWGYHNYKTEFRLRYGDEKIINFTPTPIDHTLIKKYDRLSRQCNISILSSIATLGCAIIFKVLGDIEYDKYNSSMNPDDITTHRNKSNVYQIAVYASTSLCISSAVTWGYSKVSKKSTKTQIVNSMRQKKP